MKQNIQLILVLLVLLAGKSWSQPAGLDDYNLVWTSQSRNSSESMPCGGGDIGLNVWVENGEILFYLAKSGTFDEHNAMPKLGRVRIHLNPNPFAGKFFRQELNLLEGNVTIHGRDGNLSADVKIWADVFNPVVYVEIESSQKIQAEAVYESWRYEDLLLRKGESFANSYKWAPPAGLKTFADQIEFSGQSLVFFHQNREETVFDVTVEQQGLNAVKDQLYNPLAGLTFGGLMQGKNFVLAGKTSGTYQDTGFEGWKLKSVKPASKHELFIVLNTAENYESWRSELTELTGYALKNRKAAIKQTQNWWQNYWNRSFIFIRPDKRDETDPAWQAGRNYQLFRYMLACNAYGGYPTKFNGGLFTVDPAFTDSTRNFTPDFRNWGGGTFTAQNQRLVYFPMLKSGDFDLMKPQFDFYNRILRNAELRSEFYWGHGGACFTEQMENFGLPNCSEYGWKRPEAYDPGMEYNAWLEYQWDTALEICYLILETHRYQGTDISEYLPLIKSCLTFFDEHYQYLASRRGTKSLDANDQLVLYPGSACETYKMAYNATSTIAALQTVTKQLLGLPESYSNQIDRAYLEGLLQRIPPISFTEHQGHKTIAPARLWERVNNVELPQLYPVFPWGMYGVGLPDLDVALNTWKYDPDAQKFRSHVGWKQDAIFAARMGLTKEADSLLILKLQDSDRRFPAFWGPGFDWVPDHNWGGSGMIALQEMLLQAVDEKIYLFPAWPRERDVHFKLHAPGKTTVEVELKNGEIRSMTVFPEFRRKDIMNCFD
ncbi:DUF5703 domain-containing protein [Gaoshiqia sp. Z1-71]|uniref:DUF5703 domain-containing protein n=1 Tax=Gaoshiqia hydrogeniformans TaxID=3290090 RepID=UPI003BF8273A